MRRELLDVASTTSSLRDYDTIRNAISYGMNWGTFTLTTRYGTATYEWRILGDVVEIKKENNKHWNILSVKDLDFVFSGGVYGERKELHLGFICYDNVYGDEV